jgi:pimeloyl-ACP methyl ester carboxylesterase
MAASCGGAESDPGDPRITEQVVDIINKVANGTAVPSEQLKEVISAGQGSGWLKLHPDFWETNTLPDAKDLFPSITPENNLKQLNTNQKWHAKGDGVCENLTKISVPTLILVGTDDVNVPPKDSLIIAEKIPGSWLVQIKNAGHQLPSMYPDEINKILQTFLSILK